MSSNAHGNKCDVHAKAALDMPIHIDASSWLGKPVQVETTVGELEKCLIRQYEYVNAGHTLSGYTVLLDEVLEFKVEDTMNKIKLGDEEAKELWTDFCENVLVLYCGRHATTGEEIPIVADNLDAHHTMQAVVSRLVAIFPAPFFTGRACPF